MPDSSQVRRNVETFILLENLGIMILNEQTDVLFAKI